MIRFSQVTLRRGTKALLEGADVTLNPGDKTGLIGPNGSGKTSLFELLRGELHADQGEVDYPARWRVAYVAQETPALDRPALEYAIDGDTTLRRLEQELAAAEAAEDTEMSGHRMGELHAALADGGVYTVRSRAERLLHGLGFTHEQMNEPVAAFSGGWRMRLNLAQALMCPSDLLLLDEPTNHLDLETREALTVALAQFEGTLVLVSHDRHLLRATTDQFLIVADGRLQPFDGDLDDYRDWLFKTKLGETDAAADAVPVKEAIQLPETKKAAQGKPAVAQPPVDRRGQKRREAEERQRQSAVRKPLDSRLKRLEEQLAKLNARKSAIDSQLADPALYGEAQKDSVKALIVDQAYVARELAQLEAEWIALQEQLDAVTQ
jgi:ATP-binding cassette subfamily F protein 3